MEMEREYDALGARPYTAPALQARHTARQTAGSTKAAVVDEAIPMFSTELCGRLPDAAAAAAAAIAATATAEGDAEALDKSAGGITLHLRLADATVATSDDELGDAESSGGADEGQLSFVFSSAAAMSGLFFQVCLSLVSAVVHFQHPLAFSHRCPA